MIKKIVLISSGQPSVNPRLVKEANLFSDVGYEVFVIYSFWTHWAWKNDEQLFKAVKWHPILAGGSPYKNEALYFLTRLRFKLVNILAQKLTLKYGIAEVAKGRASVELLQKAKSIKADYYIAHNLAALPSAVKSAVYHKAKCGFDAEDFHRQEVSDLPNDFNYKISQFIEDKYLSGCAYISAASPLIARAYKELYPNLKPVIINNVFEKKYLQKVNLGTQDTMKLFWFSQTIGKNRGLEDVINALNTLANNSIELHLLGGIDKKNKDYLNNLSAVKTTLHFHEPILSEDVFKFSAQFDIGLALEPGFCFNNKIALSNKLFSYITSGLAIIASNTVAQKALMEENGGIGKVYEIGNVDDLALIIKTYFEDRNLLDRCKAEASRLANEKYNWEIESVKFLTTISNNLT